VREVEVKPAPAERARPVSDAPAAPDAPTPAPPPAGPVVQFAPFVAPHGDGGVLGLSLRF
jgi:hypothetical protein